MAKKHTHPPKGLDLADALHEERHLFEIVQVPIVTVSATYRKELAKKYRSIVHTPSDVIYSRAHYSMAEAVRQQALIMGKTTHLSDPANFVTLEDWKKIEFTQKMGKLIARNKLLKTIKDKMDSITRSKLPISQAIVQPLLYLTGTTSYPIISMHYETGNILAKSGKTVIQAVTDPDVHVQYLDALPFKQENTVVDSLITYAVFDENTKALFYQVAESLNKQVREDQVVVTGPFVDPRISIIGINKKKIEKDKPINIAITTGGLGTNLREIKSVLESFRPLLVPPEKVRLFLYAGTHSDFRNFFEEFARDNNIRIGNWDDTNARIRIMHDDSIIDANENLIRYVFPWAHGIITKPSGDVAYDAAAAGCFVLFLSPWGKWEENVQKVLENEGVGFDLDISNSYYHFRQMHAKAKFANALAKAHNLPPLYRQGCRNLIELQSEKIKNS